MPAADAFVSFAEILRAEPVCAEVAPPAPVALPLPDVAELARDVRVFRARLADAFDAACDAMLRELACAVLGRELILAPPDIAEIAKRIMAEHRGAQPLRLRVAPNDVAALAHRTGVLPPIVSDAELAPGDSILEFAGGPFDARLGMRLAALLENLG